MKETKSLSDVTSPTMELCVEDSAWDDTVPLRVTEPTHSTINVHIRNVFAETLPGKDKYTNRYLCKDVHEGYDPVSRCPLSLLTHVFYMVLPPTAMYDPQAWHMELWETLVNAPQEAELLQYIQKHSSTTEPEMRHILTGSRAEHLNIPAFLCLDEDSNVSEVHQSDLDVLFSVGRVNPGRVGSDTSHPGYLRYSGPERQLMVMLYSYLQNRKLFLAQMHGPALMGDRPLTLWDFVVCLDHPDWPPAASTWVSRKRPSGWPSKCLIDDIVRNGCHILQKTPPLHEETITDENPSDSWHRYSFSVAEHCLSLSLTESQRQSYILLRILCHQKLKGHSILNSYHLKNVFFWVCEKIPPDKWCKENLAQNTLYLIDELLHFVVKRNLPHFFIPENNLLCHIPRETLADIARKLVTMRKQPLLCLQDFCCRYNFIAGPYSLRLDTVIQNLTENHQKGQSDCSVTALDRSVIEVATTYVADCPSVEALAGDFLQCTVQPSSSQHCMLMLQSYTRRVLKPFLLASDLLSVRCHQENANRFFQEVSLLLQSVHDDEWTGATKWMSEDVFSSTASNVFVSINRQLQDVAEMVLSLIPSVEVVLHALDSLLGEGVAEVVVLAQFLLSVFYSYHLIVTYHPDDLEAACHLHYLQQVQKYISCTPSLSRYSICAQRLLSHTFIKHGLMKEISLFIQTNYRAASQETIQEISQEVLAKSGQQSQQKLADRDEELVGDCTAPEETTPTGRLYNMDKHDLVDNSVSEIIRNLDFVNNIPEQNLLKNFLQKAMEDKVDPKVKEDGDPHLRYQLTYALHLFLNSEFIKSLRLLYEMMTGQESEGPPSVYYLGVLQAEKLFGRSLIGTTKRSFKKKIPVHSWVFVTYLKTMAHIHLGQTESIGTRELERACQDALNCADTWMCMSNDSTIAAIAFDALKQSNQAMYALSHAASIAYRHRYLRNTDSTNIFAKFPEEACTHLVLEASLKAHWTAVSRTDAIQGLASHFYPGRSLAQSVCCIFDILLPHPRPPEVVDEFLSRLEPASHDFKAVSEYMSSWQNLMRISHPRLGPGQRLKEYLWLRYPNFTQRDALQMVYKKMGNYIPHRIWMVTFMFSLAGEFSHYNTVLDHYLTTFYPDLPPEGGVCDLMSLLYPRLSASAALRRLFLDFKCPGVDFETAVSVLHPDPVKALVLAMHSHTS